MTYAVQSIQPMDAKYFSLNHNTRLQLDVSASEQSQKKRLFPFLNILIYLESRKK